MPEPVYAARLEFADPLTALEGLEQTARILIADVTAKLKADGKGARRFTLALFDTQNGRTEISFRMARPSCRAKAYCAAFSRRSWRRWKAGSIPPRASTPPRSMRMRRRAAAQPRRSISWTASPTAGDSEERIAQFLDRVTARLGEKAATALHLRGEPLARARRLACRRRRARAGLRRPCPWLCRAP